MYEGKGTHRFLSLLKSLSTAKLENGTKMKDYIRGVRQTADQLSEIEVKLDKVAVIGFILNGLPDTYRYLVVNLESQVQVISYEDLAARLMDEEKRIIGSQEGLKIESQIEDLNTVAANLAKSKGYCYCCKKRGHNAAQCPDKEESTTCDWCGRCGHEEENCRVKEYCKKDIARRAGTKGTFGFSIFRCILGNFWWIDFSLTVRGLGLEVLFGIAWRICLNSLVWISS